MENKSCTRAQKTKGLIHITKEILDSEQFSIPLDFLTKNSEKIDLSHSTGLIYSQYTLRLNKKTLVLYKSKISTPTLELPASQCNLDFILNFLYSKTAPLNTQDKTLSLKKQNKKLVRKLLNHIQKRKPTSKAQEIILLANENREAQYLYTNFDTIDRLPELILSTQQFKSFQTCQFLVHEKGNLYCESIISEANHRNKKTSIHVESFNSIHNVIKKSKSKKFNQSQMLMKEVKIFGTFLAKSFELKNHTIILILSRNDFISPLKEEITIFNQYCSKLKPLLSYVLERTQIIQKSHSINQVLLNYISPIAILTLKDQVLFQNKIFTEEHYYEYLSDSENFKTLPLSENRKLIIFITDNEKITSDISHFQRVSLLGELLNTLRHELSNPLFGLKLSSDLLASDIHDKETHDTLLDVSSSSERCQSIIKNFSYLYNDDEVIDLVDISKLIKETITLTKSENRQINKEVSFENFTHDHFLIETNLTWLSQIIFNLIVNSSQAIKTLKESPRKHTIFIKVIKQVDQIKILISDTGPSINKEIQKKIFNPFFTTKENGTGLGLSICRNLASRLNGKLYLSNKMIDKTTFILEIPFKKRSPS